jgi:hypothetical protein
VELVNTAELVFYQTLQVSKMPDTVSQAENAGSIPVARTVARSIHFRSKCSNCKTFRSTSSNHGAPPLTTIVH